MHHLSRFAVGLLALLITAASSTAQPQLNQFNSRFYDIRTNIPAREVKPYAGHMDRVYATFKQRFGKVFRSRRQAPPTLYLLQTRTDYIATLGSFGINATNSGGMFFYNGRGDSGLATWIDEQDPDHLWHTLQHEAFHQFAYQYIGPTLPVWANEGLAEYFGDALLVKGDLKLGTVNQRRLEMVRAAVDADASFPVADLIHITSPQWHANMGHPLRGHLQYAQSWTLAYFLIHGDRRYRAAFQNYLTQLAKGFTHAQAWEKAFGNASEQAMEARWREFIDELEPDPFSTAVHRLEFLAHGLRWLMQQGQPAPESIEQLQQQLQSRAFTLTAAMGHGGQFKIEARDDSLFSYTSAADQPEPFMLTPNPNPNLPPVIAAPRLNPGAYIEWTRDGDQLVFKIEYR